MDPIRGCLEHLLHFGDLGLLGVHDLFGQGHGLGALAAVDLLVDGPWWPLRWY